MENPLSVHNNFKGSVALQNFQQREQANGGGLLFSENVTQKRSSDFPSPNLLPANC